MNWYTMRKYLLKLSNALHVKYYSMNWNDIEKETNEHILNHCYQMAGMGWIYIAEQLIIK